MIMPKIISAPTRVTDGAIETHVNAGERAGQAAEVGRAALGSPLARGRPRRPGPPARPGPPPPPWAARCPGRPLMELVEAGGFAECGLDDAVYQFGKGQVGSVPNRRERGGWRHAGHCVDLVEQDLTLRRVEEVHPGQPLAGLRVEGRARD